MKTCTKCRREQPLSAFFRRSDGTGHRAHCKACLRRTDDQRASRRALRAASPERAVLSLMVQRCHNPKNPSFENYGARGIKVCARWQQSFEAFLEDMGPRPTARHSVERIENSKGYEPGNCKWATRAEQARNTRQNVLITARGRTQCRQAWADEAGIPANAIRDRMEKLGWDAESAIFTPVRRCRRAA
jgi:hypothetical protein